MYDENRQTQPEAGEWKEVHDRGGVSPTETALYPQRCGRLPRHWEYRLSEPVLPGLLSVAGPNTFPSLSV